MLGSGRERNPSKQVSRSAAGKLYDYEHAPSFPLSRKDHLPTLYYLDDVTKLLPLIKALGTRSSERYVRQFLLSETTTTVLHPPKRYTLCK